MKRRQNRVLTYIKRHRKGEDAPYAVGGATLGIFTLISIVLFGASWFQYIELSSNNFATVVAAVLVDLANGDRTQNGAGTLAVNPQLVAAAQAKANDMAARGYFSHNGPDGKEPWAWIRETGYRYRYAGENLAIQFSDSIEVERAWLASELHRKNILDGRFTEIGIATAYGMYQGQPTTFVVQMFGTQKESVATAPTHSQGKPAEASAIVEALPDTTVLGATYAPPEVPREKTQATLAEHIVASPQTYLHYGYGILAAILLALGFFTFSFEIRQRHFRHSIFAVLFCVALLAVLYIADTALFTNVVVTAV